MSSHLPLQLIEEIHALLEPNGAPVTPIVRKAARLATLCGDVEHRLLFELHLEGLDPAQSSLQVRKSDPAFTSAMAAFAQDRLATGDDSGILSLPLNTLEEQLQRTRELVRQNNPYRHRELAEGERNLDHILNRIRNRVDKFVRMREESQGNADGMDNIGLHNTRGRVFIGHGRSPIWKDLRDFLTDRLRLPWDEFNRETPAGKSTLQRLEEMLNESEFAFLVMTAEDEHADGTRHARENVIHEIGLFQGRLGFTKAIVLLEEGCEEFSNITGLTQIRFPKGDMMAKSEELRRVLEREKVLPTALS